MNKNIVIEIAAEKPYQKGFSYARLGFPATAAEARVAEAATAFAVFLMSSFIFVSPFFWR